MATPLPTDPFTAAERESIRTHLGYMNVQPAASIQFGLPAATQTLFMVELAMTNLLPEARPRARALIAKLDGIECRLMGAQDVLEASKLGEMETRENAPDLLEREFVRWARRLADLLGVPPYPLSTRFQGASQGQRAGSIPVRR